jgi:hypothetical protein
MIPAHHQTSPPSTASESNDHDKSLIGRVGRLEWIRANEFHIDPTYQRPVNERRVNELVANWDGNAFGVLYVSLRNAIHYLIDGQHRQRAVIAMGRPTALLPSFVIEGLTVDLEADIFWRQNKTRLQPGSADTYRARIAANEPIALGVKEMCERFGVEILMHPQPLGPAQLFALAAAEEVYRAGDLEWVLRTLRSGWPNQPGALRQNRLLGMNRFYGTFRNQFDPNKDDLAGERYRHLIERMQAHGPNEVDERAIEYKVSLHSRPSTAFARALHAAYNAHIKTNPVKLPPWPLAGYAPFTSLPLKPSDQGE